LNSRKEHQRLRARQPDTIDHAITCRVAAGEHDAYQKLREAMAAAQKTAMTKPEASSKKRRGK